MKLNEFIENSLLSILEDCNVVKINLITDNTGEVQKIIVEYVPKDARIESTKVKEEKYVNNIRRL